MSSRPCNRRQWLCRLAGRKHRRASRRRPMGSDVMELRANRVVERLAGFSHFIAATRIPRLPAGSDPPAFAGTTNRAIANRHRSAEASSGLRGHAAATLPRMDYAIAPPPVPSLPIQGSALRFPVRRIFCIGRNYAEHAKEMGAAVETGRPMFFCKPADAVVADGADVPYPSATAELHHEVEMVLALGAGGRDVPAERAAALVWGVGVG